MFHPMLIFYFDLFPANTNNAVDTGPGGRRRMLVRVRPAGSNRISEDGPIPTAEGPHVTGRAVGGDERRLSGSTLLATRGET